MQQPGKTEHILKEEKCCFQYIHGTNNLILTIQWVTEKAIEHDKDLSFLIKEKLQSILFENFKASNDLPNYDRIINTLSEKFIASYELRK
ncbi:hypothetical protein CWI37_1409p0010 [Hamiltosporidium tvaerminnensis]|uniref:Uncharacterized protein n=1 Tax=Hamiltosporidium tvaerminnensis TaxID=1176355 RepID=A0A4Q9KWG0_9MICR|nr:hypothetical protein CWI37_1409p0010 [Hamiltosporidium tvaerminnensis]